MENKQTVKGIEDLLMILGSGGNPRQLIVDAFARGKIIGKEIAKKKAIEAIEQEK